MDIRLKRAHDAPAFNDGYRVLVDRIWPRGISNKALRIDAWMKALAPSNTLRQWFGHDPRKWDGFRRAYFDGLIEQPEAVKAFLQERMD